MGAKHVAPALSLQVDERVGPHVSLPSGGMPQPTWQEAPGSSRVRCPHAQTRRPLAASCTNRATRTHIFFTCLAITHCTQHTLALRRHLTDGTPPPHTHTSLLQRMFESRCRFTHSQEPQFRITCRPYRRHRDGARAYDLSRAIGAPPAPPPPRALMTSVRHAASHAAHRTIRTALSPWTDTTCAVARGCGRPASRQN